MVDFAGWEMPLSYTGTIEEHGRAGKVGLFDVSIWGGQALKQRGDAAPVLLPTCPDI